MSISRILCVSCALALFAPSLASAAEVQFEGYYRARGRTFDTLSLDRNLDVSEGMASYIQHRVWLRPRFILSDSAAVFVDIRALDGVTWGNQPNGTFDATTQTEAPIFFSDDLSSPTAAIPGGAEATAAGAGIHLWRAWGEVNTSVGRFRVGRMPLHWGAGVWQNDGTTDPDGFKDYGDTADRISWEHLFTNIYAGLAVDVNSEGLINEGDDRWSVQGTAAYRNERIAVGTTVQYRTEVNEDSERTNLGTASIMFEGELGKLEVNGEFVGQYGNGTFEDGLDIRHAAVGGVVDAALDLDVVKLSVKGGFATGDATPGDDDQRTFTFDRDYSVGLFMFEQPMPVLANGGTGDGRNLSEVQTGNAISNALFAKGGASRELIDGLEGGVTVLYARTAAVPEEFEGRSTYGIEAGINLTYEPVEHVQVGAEAAVFMPGSWYSGYETDTYQFDDTVVGGQIVTTIRF